MASDGYEEGVYTAYAPEFDTRKMRTAGMDYLRQLQRQAYDHIKDHDVRSRVAPNLTVAEKIPTSMVLRLMITEHAHDPLHMKFVGIEQCVHEVLITVAANREHAYAYARSSAGALGLPQFMEDSYQMVRTNYPKALLEPDFEPRHDRSAQCRAGVGAAAGCGADLAAAGLSEAVHRIEPEVRGLPGGRDITAIRFMWCRPITAPIR